jgi:hypothetical protein
MMIGRGQELGTEQQLLREIASLVDAISPVVTQVQAATGFTNTDVNNLTQDISHNH